MREGFKNSRQNNEYWAVKTHFVFVLCMQKQHKNVFQTIKQIMILAKCWKWAILIHLKQRECLDRSVVLLLANHSCRTLFVFNKLNIIFADENRRNLQFIFLVSKSFANSRTFRFRVGFGLKGKGELINHFFYFVNNIILSPVVIIWRKQTHDKRAKQLQKDTCNSDIKII